MIRKLVSPLIRIVPLKLAHRPSQPQLLFLFDSWASTRQFRRGINPAHREAEARICHRGFTPDAAPAVYVYADTAQALLFLRDYCVPDSFFFPAVMTCVRCKKVVSVIQELWIYSDNSTKSGFFHKLFIILTSPDGLRENFKLYGNL